MAEISTPICKRKIKRISELKERENTPVKIPASPLMKQIGFGTGIGVYLLERSSREQSPWAIKKWMQKRSNKKNFKRLQFEAQILQKLNHPNIVGFRGFIKGMDGKPCLAMEALSTSLGEMIEKRKEMTDEPFLAKNIVKVGFEVAKGLKYLHHTAHILHGDIKSHNILVSPKFNIVKLCDFGHSLSLTPSLKEDSTSVTAYGGTQNWLPPEVVFNSEPVTSAADIWPYGIVLWEMISLTVPYLEDLSDTTEHEDSSDDIDYSRVESKYGTRPVLPNIDLNLRRYKIVLQTFYMCTEMDYKLRPTAEALVKHFEAYLNSKKLAREFVSNHEFFEVISQR